MSLAETPVQTYIKFDQNVKWKNSPNEVLARDFLSGNGESNLLWTPFFYEEKDGELFDPVRKEFVKGSANGNNVEERIITQLQDWFSNHDSGLGVWISPRNPYEGEQITIYRIGYKNIDSDQPLQKVLLFSWHQFSHRFKNPEEIRKFIFTEDDSDESVIEIINWLKRISEKPVSDNFGDIEKRLQSATNYANQYKSDVPMIELAYQMDQTKFLGDNPIGCASTSITPSQSYNSNTTESPKYSEGIIYCKNCGMCGAVIEAYIAKGYRCKSCGNEYEAKC